MVLAIYCFFLAGCIAWTEDQNGQLKSIGLPGVPVWQAKKPSPPQGLTDMALTPDQASKVSGPVLVVPPDQPNEPTRYHYYETGQNNCQQDLAKLLAEKGGSTSSGQRVTQQLAQLAWTPQAPYCTETPAAPPSKGTAFVF